MEIAEVVNKDLILRENLALERTVMANDRTLLAYVRTSLYFTIAGITLNSLLNLSYGKFLETSFYIIALLIFCIGLYRFYQQKRKLRNNRKHIGNYIMDIKSST